MTSDELDQIIRECIEQGRSKKHTLRCGALLSRRTYFVLWANYLWHSWWSLCTYLLEIFSWLNLRQVDKNCLS